MTTKPHLHPIVAPNGRVLTRVSPPDHPWQRALWFAVKYVNGENFWEEPEGEPFGNQVAVSDDGRIEWTRPNGEVVIDEQRTIAVHDHVIDWTSALTPRTDVVLDRTPYTTWGGYGGLTLRGAGDWEETRLLLDDGSVHRRPEGVRSRWCDLASEDAGLLFLDHPDNVRHPVPWYGATRSRVYGEGWSNYLNAAFLWDAPMDLAAGDTLTMRYRVIAHDGAWDVARCDDEWRRWTSGG